MWHDSQKLKMASIAMSQASLDLTGLILVCSRIEIDK